MKQEILIGTSEDHLINFKGHLIHKEIKTDLELLIQAAAYDGIELTIASSYRSYARQKIIWNEKATGIRPILDKHNNIICPDKISPDELLWAILNYSAIPGCSRHHWGTDLDIYDLNALPFDDYKLQLTSDEYLRGGPFHSLHKWLSIKTQQDESFSFIRPFMTNHLGHACEPWHISYAPLSNPLQKSFDYNFFVSLFQLAINDDLELRDQIKKHSAKIFKNFIQCQ